MSVIVTDDGFRNDDWSGPIAPLSEAGAKLGVDVPSDADPAAMPELAAAGLEMIRIDFPAFSDGRGFTLARRLRQAGFAGRLRARGHVLADQYTMARRSGFDEVEISDDLARRQPEAQWRARADWRAHDYRAGLGARTFVRSD